MNETQENRGLAHVRTCLLVFLEGHLSYGWLLDAIEASGARGCELEEVFEQVRGHGNPELYQVALSLCRRHGWIE